jgi:hypothetical protein
MSKRRSRKSGKSGPSERAAERPRAHKVVWGVALGLATLLGGFASAMAFLPRITVTPSDPPVPQNPFTASFTIANSGLIPLRDVVLTYFPFEVEMTPALFNESKRPPIDLKEIQGFTFPQWAHHNLPIDERFTITAEHIIGPANSQVEVGGADVVIVTHYQPWFVPWRRERQFRFVTHRQPNGGFTWYSFPMD